jgi:sideroflexin-5
MFHTTVRFIAASSSSSSVRSARGVGAAAAASIQRRCTPQQLRFQSATNAAVETPSLSKAAAAAAATAEKASESSSSSSSVPIVTSLLAAGLAICTVSAAAAIVEHQTAQSGVPGYDPQGQRYDQGNFGGRFCRMLLACDPRLLLYTEEQVRSAKAMLDQHNLDQKNVNREKNNDNSNEDRVLWEARRMVESALHPDTGDLIPRPFRMSGYCPYNGPVCVAMVASQSTMPLLFWAWVNQSQNALVNYYNRNASSPMTNETLLTSYSVAVGSALAVAFGLATIIQKRFEPSKAKQLLRWVAFPSSVVASSLNCYIVRSPEITTGIPLLNEQGENVVAATTSDDNESSLLSQIAAARGVYSTTASRAILQAPVYFLPPLLLATVGPLRNLLTKSPALTVPITTYLLLVSFGVGLPATVAIFPQISSIPASDVEAKFQHLREPKTQKPYEVFYYNKGL